MISHRRIGSVNSGAVTLAFLLSVGLNALLGTLVLRPHSSTTAGPPTDTALQQPGQLTRALSPPPGGAGSRNAGTQTAFHWSQIESSDYRQYIVNLRAVGCPEEIIRDIIMADLNQAYAVRAAAIWKPKQRDYWQKRGKDEPTSEQQKKLEALSHEKAEICKELFGVRLHDQKLIDTVFLQTHGSESELAFLPEDRREAALAALSDSGFDEKELRLRESGDYWNQREELLEEKLKLLSSTLSPPELDEFKMRNSELANNLRTEVRYFDLTPNEFRLLFDARENDPHRSDAGNLLDRSLATEEVRKLLGEERANTFERVTDMFYINARKAVEDNGLDPDLAEQAWQAAHDARSAAEQVMEGVGFSAEERTNRVQAITSAAEAKLRQVLGEKISVPLQNDLDTVLKNRLAESK